jgi:Uncharacterized protein conserved in bacteria
MAELRDLLGDLGYTGVATLLNSGNAVFQATQEASAWHAAEIAGAIASRLRVDVPVIVKSAEELSAIVAENPLVNAAPDHSRLLVAFVQDPTSLSGIAGIESLVVPPEKFLVGRGAAYLHCATGILESKAAGALLGRSGKAATTRNWATVLKLQVLASGSDVDHASVRRSPGASGAASRAIRVNR